MDKLVTVMSSEFEANLAVAQSYLADNEIDCVVLPNYLTIVTGKSQMVKLQVREEDYERAIQLLKEGKFIK